MNSKFQEKYIVHSGFSCPKTTFHCIEENSCISLSQICDGIKDCSMGEDEKNCLESIPLFSCIYSSAEIPLHLVCDLQHHCPDGTDERFCCM